MAGRRLWWGVAVALAAAGLALVLGSAQAETVYVEIDNFAFSPQDLTVQVGDTVVWTNNDTAAWHDVTFEAGFGSGAKGAMGLGETFSHTFDTAGDFPYRCQNHSSDFASGMVGSVTVESALPAADHYIEMMNIEFDPKELHIEPGQTVVWINNATFAHDILFEAGFGSGGAASMDPGATYSHTFSENGTYRYRCQVHSANFDAGMVGVITVGTVEDPAPQPSPGFDASVVALAFVGALLAAGIFGSRRK